MVGEFALCNVKLKNIQGNLYVCVCMGMYGMSTCPCTGHKPDKYWYNHVDDTH